MITEQNIQYPEITPFQDQLLQVDKRHHLYIQQYGNPAGIPIVVLHGGPGAGLSEKAARLFDPTQFHVILFDQRGCGRSVPNGSLITNTTQDLVEDIEKIKQHLNIQAWHVMGGSWGSTLALLYGQTYPKSCISFILRGIFLGTKEELQWSKQGAKLFYPDAWQKLCDLLDVPEQEELEYPLLEALLDSPSTAVKSARAFCEYEYRIAQFIPPKEVKEHTPEIDQMLLTFAKLMIHYFKNKFFLKPNQILNNMPFISPIPATIIHGRYDMVCPLHYAYRLHQAWPGSQLRIIEDANHSGSTPSVIEAMIGAINKQLKEI